MFTEVRFYFAQFSNKTLIDQIFGKRSQKWPENDEFFTILETLSQLCFSRNPVSGKIYGPKCSQSI